MSAGRRPPPAGPGPVERGAPPARRPRAAARRRGGLGVFLLAGALPAAAAVWIATRPAAERDALLARIPAGWAGRAAHAAIAFGVMLVLARVALPAFHGASGALRRASDRLAARRGLVRVLLAPVEALVGLLRLLVQALFAVDAALIVAAGLVLLLLVLRIARPDTLPDLLPTLGR